MPKRDLATAFGRCCRFFDHQPMHGLWSCVGLRGAGARIACSPDARRAWHRAVRLAVSGAHDSRAAGRLRPWHGGACGRAAQRLVPLPSPWAVGSAVVKRGQQPGAADRDGRPLVVLAAMLRKRDHPATRQPGTASAGDPINRSGNVGFRWHHRLAPLVRRVSCHHRDRCLDPSRYQLFATLIHPDDSDWVNQRYRAAYDPAVMVGIRPSSASAAPTDGAERWVAATGRMFFDAKGKLVAGGRNHPRHHRSARCRCRIAGKRGALPHLGRDLAPEAVHVHRDGVIILANQQAAETVRRRAAVRHHRPQRHVPGR